MTTTKEILLINMKRITNTEEANFYFKKVNELIDDYIKNHKIKPSEISNYINRNYKSFLEEVDLKDVENIKTVVDNVLEHRLNMQKDSILKFENFAFVNENNKSTIEHEKVLADFFNTSIGHVEILNSKFNLFTVNDFGKKELALIFSEQEFVDMKEDIVQDLLKSAKNKVLAISEIDNVNLGFSLRFWLSEFIDDDQFIKVCEGKLSVDKLSELLKVKLEKESVSINFKSRNLIYKGKVHDYHVWIIITKDY